MHRRIAVLSFLPLLLLAFASSAQAQLTPPVIVSNPTNQTLTQGATARFQVSATGSSNLVYRWWKDGNPVLLPPNRFLTITNVQPSDAGAYHATVSNSVGTATSRVAVLTVILRPPLITAQPLDAILCPGGSNATLSVTATGSLPLVYQWQFNGADIPFAASRTLTVPGSLANIGDYSVVITNSSGAVTSRVARLAPAITILDQPQTWQVLPGGSISLSIVAVGCTPVSYQWRRNTQPLAGAVQSALLISNAVAGDAGNYDCVVTDRYSSKTSSVATITVLSGAPVIIMQPNDRLEVNDTNVTFDLIYSSIPVAFVQWRFNGVNIPGATNSHLSFPLNASSEGGYSAVVTNVYGSVTSRVATLTLAKYPPSLQPWTQPISQALCPGQFGNALYTWPSYPVVFPVTFRWRLNGTNVPGGNDRFLYLHGQPSQAGDYTVVIANAFGAVTSEVAQVTLPRFLLQPQSMVVRDGQFGLFSIGFESCGPTSAQWERNGTPIPGAEQFTLWFSPARMSDVGDYRVVVTHPFGSITSAVARLDVTQDPPVVFDGSPEDQQVFADEWAHFTLSYDSGSPGAAFQWYFNGAPIPGKTFDALHFQVTSAAQQGRYYAVLSNAAGSATSRVARLTVLFSAPFFEWEPEDITVDAGSFAYFFARATGAPRPKYQWLFNGVPISGETNENLAVRIRGQDHHGAFSVIASNLLGSVTSRVAQVEVITYPPGIAVEPIDQYAQSGTWVTFACVVTSAPPAALQWYFNGDPIAGATNYYLQFRAGFSNQIGGYRIVATSELGSVTSRVAQLNLTIFPPVLYAQPQPQSVVEGESFTLRAGIQNNTPVLAQWQRDGIDIPNATNEYFYRFTSTTNDTGDYRIIIRNDVASATSQVARVEVRRIGPLETWHWRRPSPQGDHLSGLAFGGGLHVAVGWEKGVAISTNGTDWFDARHPTKPSYRSGLCFGNGTFVTLTFNTQWTLESSSNGVDWAEVSLPTGMQPSTPAFGNGRFVAAISQYVGNQNIYPGVIVSTNGIDWEVQPLEAPESLAVIAQLKFSGDRFFAVGISPGFASRLLYVSDDGVRWTATDLPLNSADLLISHDGQRYFIAHPNFGLGYVSTNTVNWFPQSISGQQQAYTVDLAYGNSIWVLAGYRGLTNSGLQWSTDTRNWQAVPDVGSNGVTKMIFDGTRFVAVGNYGFTGISTNGRDWHVINPGTDVNLRSITRADGLFVTVGGGGRIYTSTDGRDWTPRNSGTAFNLRNVTRFKDYFVAVGEQDFPGAPSTIRVSRDGITWLTPLTGALPTGDLYALAHNGHRLVVVGDYGAIAVTTDGLNWTNLPSGAFQVPGTPAITTTDLNAITWTGDRFTIVGKDGTVFSSPDGLSWRFSGPGGGRNLHGIAYGNGVHVIVANNGRTFHSLNGTNWTIVDLPATGDFSDVQFANGRFIAVGDNGIVHTSTNGSHWTRRPTACGNDLRSVLYADGSYYAVGNNETILQSAQVDAHLRVIPATGGGLPAIAIVGETGRAYRLQGSSDLNEWFDIQTVTPLNERRVILPVPPAFTSSRFFRLVSP